MTFVMDDGTSQTVTATNYNLSLDIVHTYTTPIQERFIGFYGWCSVSTWTSYNIGRLYVMYGPDDCTLSSAITLSGLSSGYKLIPSDPATSQTITAKDNMGGRCGAL